MNPYTVGHSKDTALYDYSVIHLPEARSFFTAIRTKPLLPDPDVLNLDEWRRIMRAKEHEFNVLSTVVDGYLKLAGHGNMYSKEEITKLVLATPFDSSLTVVYPGVVHTNSTNSGPAFASHPPCLGILLLSLGPTNLFAGHMSFTKHGLRLIRKDYAQRLIKFIAGGAATETHYDRINSRPVGISVSISPKQKGMCKILTLSAFEVMERTDDTIEFFMLSKSFVELERKIQAGLLSKRPGEIRQKQTTLEDLAQQITAQIQMKGTQEDAP